MRVIAVANFKGGSAKTTLTVNLAHALAATGELRVLVLDADPQLSATTSLGKELRHLDKTLYELMTEYRTRFVADLRDAIYATAAGVALVPATPRLNLIQDDLVGGLRREEILRGLLATVADDYDVCLIDNMPYMGVLVDNALMAADDVLIPMPPEALAIESFKLLLDRVALMQRPQLNPRLRILGMVLTRVDMRKTIHRDAVAYLRETYGEQMHVFETMLKEAVILQEAAAAHQTVLEYLPKSAAADAFRALAAEVRHAW